MNGITRVGLAALLGAGIALGGAATASADGSLGDQSGSAYAEELWRQGFTGTYVDARDLGATVCRARATGNSEKYLIDRAEALPEYNREDAVVAILGAEFHFCPAYATTYNRLSKALLA